MRLTFLGTGGATARGRFNSAVAVDERLSRAGIDPDGIRCLLLSHCHGDHFVGLGTFLIDRVLARGPSLMLLGPPGAEERLDTYCRALWGNGWRSMGRGGFDLKHVTIEAGERVEAEDYEIEMHEIQHDNGYYDATPSVGYVLDDGQMKLGYTGDTAPGPWVDGLLDRCDVAIIECSGPDPGPTHLSDGYVRELAGRHPTTGLILTHFGAEPPTIDGATVAEDLATIEVERGSY
jgi:ribonuclease BN (tRNA processing enzyme)